MKAIRGITITIMFMAKLMAGNAYADDVVLVPSSIPYQKEDTANESIRRECTWNTTMPQYLAKKSDGRVEVAVKNIDTANDKKLMLVATHLHAIGGGGWTGPKWLSLEGKLFEKGKLIGNFEARRQTIRGSFKTCGTLESLSEEIGDDILEWLNNPGLNAKLGNAG